ncbi:MAG: response regulator, partial [Myxococcales bacterium]|nr:response regulator [Myxococcales bacterium]
VSRPSKSPHRGWHTLLASSDPGWRKSFRDALEGRGARVTVATSADEIHDALNGQGCHCICVDMNLVGMGGLKSVGFLAKRHPNVPVVLVHDGQDEDLEQEALRGELFECQPKDHPRALLAIRNAGRLGVALARAEASAPPQADRSVPWMNAGGGGLTLEQIERRMIEDALRNHGDEKVGEIAKRLGIGRTTLYRKMRTLKLRPKGAARRRN